MIPQSLALRHSPIAPLTSLQSAVLTSLRPTPQTPWALSLRMLEDGHGEKPSVVSAVLSGLAERGLAINATNGWRIA